MLVKKIPYDDDIRKAIWPSFKLKIEDKHGKNGAQGLKGEEAAIKLIEQDYPQYTLCLDHSEDVAGQYQGIDLTLFSKSGILTVDVKSGKTGLYWDRDNMYWYITIKDEFFIDRKINEEFFHVGLKGDKYARYLKKDMKNLFNDRRNIFIKDEYGYRLKKENWPDFITHNIKRY
jgi:hypothetical protein